MRPAYGYLRSICCNLEKVSKHCLISVLTEMLVGFTMEATSKENQHDTDTIGGKIHFALG